MDFQKQQWEDSYSNRDNFLFYPHEEVIRFISKYIRKRTGLSEFKDVLQDSTKKRVLDFGCGIGRHVMYCHDMGLVGYGIDLSKRAVAVAHQWAREKGIEKPEERIVVGEARTLPWVDSFFDFVVSHGVLDSMHFEMARAACRELARVLKPEGLFYCDLVSGDDSVHAREFAGEEKVTTVHEHGTIQCYYNFTKINELIADSFELLECNLIRCENVLSGNYTARYHLVLKGKEHVTSF
jgi:SAM-dependent methyltransferase